MNIDLKALSAFQESEEHFVYNDSEDDIRSILMDVCKALSDKLNFSVSGFGQARWPVDASTDLPVFIEQLPHALNALASGEAAQIDFYEQGLERSLTFFVEKNLCRVLCQSWSSWKPVPTEEILELGCVREMLGSVQTTFLRVLEAAFPVLRHHPWVVAWEKGEELI